MGPSTASDPAVDAIVALAAACRQRGMRAGTGEVILARRALEVLAGEPDVLRGGLQSVLCASRADLDRFAAAFEEVLGAPDVSAAVADGGGMSAAMQTLSRSDEGEEEDRPAAAFSDAERLWDLDFAAYTDEDLRMAAALVQRIARKIVLRPSRRATRSTTDRGRIDVRATLARSTRTYGEPSGIARRRPDRRPRRLVLVADVSGSMRPYVRALLQFAQVAAGGQRPVEVFVFATRVTRVTSQLRERRPDRALTAAAGAVDDWSSGTRIGEAFADLNRRYRGYVGLGADVIVFSDGWDRGDPEQLGREAQRLRHRAHRLIWANPLAGLEGYEPLTRGMVAAMPHAHRLVPVASLRTLDQLADLLLPSDPRSG
jgi:uncharacterized protein with von Willebrand factor type A (vWA) domain